MTEEACTIEEHNELARIYGMLELYTDMTREMKAIVELREAAKEQLSMEERNRLSIAYKHIIGRQRNAWRTINEILSNTKNPIVISLASEVRGQIKKNILDKCQEVNCLLESQDVTQDEAGVFLLKMRADYHRYQAEVSGDESEYRDKATKLYNDATELALNVLSPISTIRLGLLLNYTVFLFEILKDPTSACDLAKDTLDKAIQELDDVTGEGRTEVTLILQLLRDNLTIWTADEVAEN